MLAHQIPTSAAVDRLSSEGAFELLARARELEAQGRDILHFEVGEPDFETPEHIKAAAIEALGKNQTHYTPSAGLPQLRDAVAEYASRFRGMTGAFARENVVISPGLKPLVWNVLSVLLDAGDEMVYADPAYPAYASCADYLGAKAIAVPLRESSNFRLDLEALAAAMSPRTKVLVLNSPQNPTGGVLTRSDLETIAELALRYDVTVVSDEIYSRNIYDAAFTSIATLDGMRDRTLILDGFSKAYAMTGWRLGYGVMPPSVARAATLIGQNNYSCVTAFVQWAGIAALQGPDEPVRAMVAQFRERRDKIVAGLNALPGISCKIPEGAFYAFPNVSAITSDDRKLSSFLLEEAGVAALGGSCFGEYGRGYLRFSYAASLPTIESALERMRGALPHFKG